jgi:hypothetical protein
VICIGGFLSIELKVGGLTASHSVYNAEFVYPADLV